MKKKKKKKEKRVKKKKKSLQGKATQKHARSSDIYNAGIKKKKKQQPTEKSKAKKTRSLGRFGLELEGDFFVFKRS